MMLYYRITIFTYELHMHRILRFQICNVLEWQTSINSFSLFEVLTYLARLSLKIRFRDKAFKVSQLSDCFEKVYYHLGGLDINGTNISHICTQFAINIFFYHSRLYHLRQNLAWSNLIRYVCAEFGIYFSQLFLLFYLRI